MAKNNKEKFGEGNGRTTSNEVHIFDNSVVSPKKIKALPELIPIKEVMEFRFDDPLNFGKCKVCGRDYSVYHIRGVCFDCDFDKRMTYSHTLKGRVSHEEKLWEA